MGSGGGREGGGPGRGPAPARKCPFLVNI